MGLLKPFAYTLTQPFDGAYFAEPPMHFQLWRGVPLACLKDPFPGESGSRKHYHAALDLAAPCGTPIRASEAGKVAHGVDLGGALWMSVEIRPGVRFYHWHLARLAAGIVTGSKVARGQVIAYVGNTGRSTGCHSHFMLKMRERDPDGVTRDYFYNPSLFLVGGLLANDHRIRPA